MKSVRIRKSSNSVLSFAFGSARATVRNGCTRQDIRSRFRGRVDSISRYYLVEPILFAMLPRGQVRYAPVLRDVKPQTTTTDQSEVSILMKGSCWVSTLGRVAFARCFTLRSDPIYLFNFQFPRRRVFALLHIEPLNVKVKRLIISSANVLVQCKSIGLMTIIEICLY